MILQNPGIPKIYGQLLQVGGDSDGAPGNLGGGRCTLSHSWYVTDTRFLVTVKHGGVSKPRLHHGALVEVPALGCCPTDHLCGTRVRRVSP